MAHNHEQTWPNTVSSVSSRRYPSGADRTVPQTPQPCCPSLVCSLIGFHLYYSGISHFGRPTIWKCTPSGLAWEGLEKRRRRGVSACGLLGIRGDPRRRTGQHCPGNALGRIQLRRPHEKHQRLRFALVSQLRCEVFSLPGAVLSWDSGCTSGSCPATVSRAGSSTIARDVRPVRFFPPGHQRATRTGTSETRRRCPSSKRRPVPHP